MPERLLTVGEACERLHVCRRTLFVLFARGELQRTRIGARCTRVEEQEVERFIASLGERAPKVRPRAPAPKEPPALDALMAAWSRATPEERRRFLEWAGQRQGE